MAYIRTKARGDRQYAYVVHGFREGGRVRQRVLLYVGNLQVALLRDEDIATLRDGYPDLDIDGKALKAGLMAKQKAAYGYSFQDRFDGPASRRKQSRDREREQDARDQEERFREWGERAEEARRATFEAGAKSVQHVVPALALEIIQTGYRAMARKRHPDAGGSHEDMVTLNKGKALLMRLLVPEEGETRA